jgi:dUTP pyrophosphatase
MIAESDLYYYENGYRVFTAKLHLSRGHCCGCKCRHCPFYPKYIKNNKTIDLHYIPKSMKVRIKKLNENAVIPKYAKPGDAGMDLTATEIQYTSEYVSYKTGLAFEIPEGYVGLLFPRSSNSKKSLLLTNSVGVVDSGYRGEIEFRFKLVGNGTLHKHNFDIGSQVYNIGDKVGQIIILPYPTIEFEEVEDLSSTERGSGGFGSSGN